jgi:hypothetical protein
VQSIFKKESVWKIETQNENYIAEKLILATGSNPKYGRCYKPMVTPRALSLPFTFNIKDSRIKELPGVAAQVTVKVKDTKLSRRDLY